jgi:hypothetical protein
MINSINPPEFIFSYLVAFLFYALVGAILAVIANWIYTDKDKDK